MKNTIIAALSILWVVTIFLVVDTLAYSSLTMELGQPVGKPYIGRGIYYYYFKLPQYKKEHPPTPYPDQQPQPANSSNVI